MKLNLITLAILPVLAVSAMASDAIEKPRNFQARDLSHASASVIEAYGRKDGQLILSFYGPDTAYGGFKAVEKIVQQDATDCKLQFGSEGFNEYVKSAREVFEAN